MVASNPDGDELKDGQLLCESDLRKLEIACSNHLHRVGTRESRTETLTRLAETIACCDLALTDQILRRWGIRR